MSNAIHDACMTKVRASSPSATNIDGHGGSVIAAANVIVGNANRSVNEAYIAIYKAKNPGAASVSVSGAISWLSSAAGIAAIKA